MYKKILIGVFSFLLISSEWIYAQEQYAFLLRHTLLVKPNKIDSSRQKWVPFVRFQLVGPTPPEATIQVTFFTSDQKKWLTLSETLKELAEGEYADILLRTYENEHETSMTGTFFFDIRVLSELEGVDQPLYYGSFEIDHFFEMSRKIGVLDWNDSFQESLDQATLPQALNDSIQKFLGASAQSLLQGENTVVVLKSSQQWRIGNSAVMLEQQTENEKKVFQVGVFGGEEFYEKADAVLPIGLLSTNNDADLPQLNIFLWFKGEAEHSNFAAYLYYNGTKILGGTDSEQVDIEDARAIDPTKYQALYKYKEFRFEFPFAMLYMNSNMSHTGKKYYDLSKNPGDYEIKILRNKKLARSVKFKVAPNGQIEKTGAIEPHRDFGLNMRIPVTILGDADGIWDAKAYETKAFYGNPGLETDVFPMELFYSSRKIEESPAESEFSPEVQQLTAKVSDEATNIYRWYYDEMKKYAAELNPNDYNITNCDTALMYLDQLMPLLDKLEKQTGSDHPLAFNSQKETTPLKVVKEHLLTIRTNAEKVKEFHLNRSND